MVLRPVTKRWDGDSWLLFAGPCVLHSLSASWLGTISVPEMVEPYMVAVKDATEEPAGLDEQTLLLPPHHDVGVNVDMRQWSLAFGRDFFGPLEFRSGLWVRAIPPGTGSTSVTALILPC